jgi:hypothetical protein
MAQHTRRTGVSRGAHGSSGFAAFSQGTGTSEDSRGDGHSSSASGLGPGRSSSKRQLSPPPTAGSNKRHRQSKQQQQPQRSRTTPGAAAASGRPSLPAHVVHAMRRTKLIQSTKTPQQLLALLQQDAGDINHISVGAAYYQATKLCRNGAPPKQQPAAAHQLLQHLHQLTDQLQQQCDTRTLSNIIWACGQLH